MTTPKKEQIKARLNALRQYEFSLLSSMPDEGVLTDLELERIAIAKSQLNANFSQCRLKEQAAMPTLEERRKQVSDQCRVVAHLAETLAQINNDFAKMFGASSGTDYIIDRVGRRSARHMKILGDILNGMDIVDKKDRWVDPIFHKAQEMYPQLDSQ